MTPGELYGAKEDSSFTGQSRVVKWNLGWKFSRGNTYSLEGYTSPYSM